MSIVTTSDTESANPVDEEEVRDALRTVIDPELGVDVVSLGLVYGITIIEDRVHIEMTLTTPGCPVSEMFPAAAAQAVEAHLGNRITDVHVDLVWDPPWTPDRIEPRTLERIGSPSPSR